MDIPRTQPRRRAMPLVAVALTAALFAAATLGTRALRRAAPDVSRASVATAQVKRGLFEREVRGSGRLVPEETRWITAVTAGRVEHIALKPGAPVHPDTVLVTLENPDVVFAALQAERELSTARTEAYELEGRLKDLAFADEAAAVTLDTELSDIERRVRAYHAEQNLIVGTLEQKQAEDRAHELARRHEIATARVRVAQEATHNAMAAYREQLVRRAEVARFRREQVSALAIRAGAEGVVVDVLVEPGQWAAPGAVLATVARPDRLKAEIRIPEQQAKDLALGQRARVDTHNGILQGTVARVATTARDGAVLVEVALEGALPPGARPQLNVEARMLIDTVPQALFVERPTSARPEAQGFVYRLTPDGSHAERVAVSLGRASTLAVEITSGLREGDTIIVSDSTTFEADRVALR